MLMNTKFYYLPLVAISLFFQGCDSGSAHQRYAEARLSVEEQERMNPTTFLMLEGATYRKNLIGEFVLEGTINNLATVATYKDVVITAEYYSQTDTFIGSESLTLYELYQPNSARKFKLKSFGYKGSDKVGFRIENASTAN
jgi:hypothetical protein